MKENREQGGKGIFPHRHYFKCAVCGKFIGYAEFEKGKIKINYRPETVYESEEVTHVHMKNELSKNEQPCTIHSVKRCYYDDELCGGKIIAVGGFKKYLCEKCKKEEDSVPDDCGDIHDFSISDR